MVQQAAPPGEQLAYINPQEAQMLKQAGGSGRRDNNPFGIMSFDREAPGYGPGPDYDDDYYTSGEEVGQTVDLTEAMRIASDTARNYEPSGVDHQGGDEQRRSGYRRDILTTKPVAEADRWSKKALDKYKGTPYGAHMRAMNLGLVASGSLYSMDLEGKYTGPGGDEYDPNKWNRLKSGMVSELVSGNASPELIKHAATLGLNLDQLSPAAGSLAENLTGRINDYNLWNQDRMQKVFSPEQLAEMGINIVDFTQDQLNTIAEVEVDISLGPTPKDRYLDTASPNVPLTESIITTLMPGAGIAEKYDPSPRDKSGYPTSIAGSRMQFNPTGLALQMILPPGIGTLVSSLTTGGKQYPNAVEAAGTATGKAIKEYVVDPVKELFEDTDIDPNIPGFDIFEDPESEEPSIEAGIKGLRNAITENITGPLYKKGEEWGQALKDTGINIYDATIGQLPNVLPDDFNL
jgi:hypothetical protein